MIHFQGRSKIVVVDETMHHFYTAGFHWMLLTEFVFGYVLVVEVTHLAHYLYIDL